MMKIRYTLPTLLLIIGGMIYGIVQYSTEPPTLATTPAQTKKTPKASLPQPLPDMAAPARFSAPSLNISAPIEHVGLTTTGDMDVPASETSLGWYKKGAFPGNAGPAVLAGHTGLPNKPSPFRKLESLKVDDIVQIEDISGTMASFQIIETAVYTPTTAPRERIFGPTTTARLTIITCSGTWIPKQKSYSHRFVLYAVRTNDVD